MFFFDDNLDSVEETESGELDENLETEETVEDDENLVSDEFENNELKELNQQILNLQQQIENLKEVNLRLRAEFENFKKRTNKEKQGLYSSSQVDCVSSFLPILDGLERAVKTLSTKDDEVGQGVNLIVDQFLNVLKNLGIESVAKEGEPFDPKFHSAVKTVENENFGQNVVCEVLQKGYCKGDLVVRHAMVVVANP